MKVTLSAALLATIMTVAAVGPSAADGVWRDPVDISPAAQEGSTPQIVSSTDGKNLTSAWISQSGSVQRATAAFSTNHGSTWSPIVPLTAGDSSDIHLAGSADGRRAVATFVDFQSPSQEIVRTATFTDGVWASAVDVSALAASSGKPDPAVAMTQDGTRVIAVFAQFNGSVHQIQSRVSTNSGASYAPAVAVAANVTEPDDIDVVSSSDGQRLIAVWKEQISGVDAIRAAFSTNGGGTWSSPERLSTVARNSIKPDLITDTQGATSVAVWQEKVSDTERRIHTRTLANGFWSSSVQLSTSGHSDTDARISGALDGSRATVVWANNTLQRIEVAHGIGSSWSGPVNVSEAGIPAQVPDVASGADGKRVAVVWRKSGNQILSAQSADGGATWSGLVSTSATAPVADDPRIAAAASGFRFAAVWNRNDGTNSRIQAGTYFEAQPQSIAFATAPDQVVGETSALSATASSGLPVTLVSSTPGTCSVTGNQLTALAVGTCTIIASQAGNIDFLPAAGVTRTLAVISAPTPNPEPVVRRTQSLTCAKTPPNSIKRRGSTVVLPKNCLTNAGQKVSVTVGGKSKDLKRIKVLKKAGKTSIKTQGARVRLTVTYTAPEVSTFEALRLVVRYRT